MTMKKVLLKELEPGMTLGQPVNDAQGRTIMPAGARLTPMYISRLEKWGIKEVVLEVEGEEEDAAQPVSAGVAIVESASDEDREAMRGIAQEAQTRFKGLEGNPLMDELKRLSVKHLVLQGKA